MKGKDKMKRTAVFSALAASTMLPITTSADQYWVGGTSGLWGGDNWATEAGGTGGAWTSGSHVYFGSGSSYTKPAANSNGSLYVGMFSATSNTVTVAEGATMNVNGDAYIGCSRNDTEVACIGVVHVADGTLNVSGVLYMARSTSNNKTKNAGTGTLVVDEGGTVNVTGNIKSARFTRKTTPTIARRTSS